MKKGRCFPKSFLKCTVETGRDLDSKLEKTCTQNEGFCSSRLPETLAVNGIELVGKQKVVGHLVLEDMTLKIFKTEHCRKTVGTTFSRL